MDYLDSCGVSLGGGGVDVAMGTGSSLEYVREPAWEPAALNTGGDGLVSVTDFLFLLSAEDGDPARD